MKPVLIRANGCAREATDAAAEHERGPIDDRVWPDTLPAHVVEADDEPRLHGYAVESDLSLHYGFGDMILLASIGELPSPAASRAFEVALGFLAPISVAEAPVHAACLSRICGAEPTGTLGVAAIALGEQVRFEISEHAALFDWMERGGHFPEKFTSTDAAERDSVKRLQGALGRIPFEVPALDEMPTRTAALLAVFWATGLRDRELVALAWVLARLPVAFAEARHHRAGSLRDYPMNTPVFRYRPPEATR